jgi:pyruvate-formate lyase
MMDILNINNGQFRVDDQGNIYVNGILTYDRNMNNNFRPLIECELRETEKRLRDQTIGSNHTLQIQLETITEKLNAVILLLAKNKLIESIDDIDKLVLEMKDSVKLADKLKEIKESEGQDNV